MYKRDDAVRASPRKKKKDASPYSPLSRSSTRALYFRSPPWWWFTPTHAERSKLRRVLSCSQCCCTARRWPYRSGLCGTPEELTEISSLPRPLFKRWPDVVRAHYPLPRWPGSKAFSDDTHLYVTLQSRVVSSIFSCCYLLCVSQRFCAFDVNTALVTVEPWPKEEGKNK